MHQENPENGREIFERLSNPFLSEPIIYMTNSHPPPRPPINERGVDAGHWGLLEGPQGDAPGSPGPGVGDDADVQGEGDGAVELDPVQRGELQGDLCRGSSGGRGMSVRRTKPASRGPVKQMAQMARQQNEGKMRHL